MKLQKDLREFIGLLNSHSVKYLIVGAYGVAYYGIPRFTGDIDFFVECSPENAAKLERVIHSFGFESTGLRDKDFCEPKQIIQLGIAPHRIDILTGIDGVHFDEAWSQKVEAEMDGLNVHILSKDLLIKNKLATGRDQDIADVNRLNKL
jgi:hypothetical protein